MRFVLPFHHGWFHEYLSKMSQNWISCRRYIHKGFNFCRAIKCKRTLWPSTASPTCHLKSFKIKRNKGQWRGWICSSKFTKVLVVCYLGMIFEDWKKKTMIVLYIRCYNMHFVHEHNFPFINGFFFHKMTRNAKV